ncbi:MAG: long-chain fatty acid--CoA ligase [bacterium]|nr:long-chain fatty acid--CoA ligase [bacterium]
MTASNSLGMAIINTCRRRADHPALLYKTGERYQPVSYGELGRQITTAAQKLISLGIKPGERIGIMSNNRPEWVVVDLAALCCGIVVVPVYVSLSAAEVQYILKDAEVTHLFAENEVLANKAKPLLDAGQLLRIWIFKGSPKNIERISDFAKFLADSSDRETLDQRNYEVDPDKIKRSDLATIIYTSGTTGIPKGVRLTHGNLLSNMEQILGALDISENDTMLSLLPLAHVFERTCGHFLMFSLGGTVAYAESPAKAIENLQEIKPTIMMAVPRFFEKVKSGIENKIRQSPPLKRKIFSWGMKIGGAVNGDRSESPGILLKLSYPLADLLVLKKIRQVTGGRMRFWVSGGAALPKYVGEFFLSAGVLMLEGYGLTEASPVISANRPENHQSGTIGLPLPGIEVKLTSEGEILVRGPNVMQGYHHLPEETEAVLQSDGFLRTGDLGKFDDAGRLIITGRKKELIVTSGGRNVAPATIEDRIKVSPFISEALVIGDGRRYLTALIVPDFEQLQVAGLGNGISANDSDGLVTDPALIRLIGAEIARESKELASYERIMKFALLNHPFSIESGELTPSLKIRRKVVEEKYSDVIEEMYRN